jgi:hypothetical protein
MRQLPKTAMRDFHDATRFACALFKHLPVRPLLGVIAVSVTLGALPLMLTAIYSLIRTMVDCYRDAVNMLAQRGRATTTLANRGESVPNHFIQSIEPVETL